MQQIQLSEKLYLEVQARAAETGFASVDAYVAEVLKQEFYGQTENLDDLFTPERLAQIAKAEAEIARGESYTLEQVDAELGTLRAEWIRQNPDKK